MLTWHLSLCFTGVVKQSALPKFIHYKSVEPGCKHLEATLWPSLMSLEISRSKDGGKEDMEYLVRDFEETGGTEGPGKKCEGYNVEK